MKHGISKFLPLLFFYLFLVIMLSSTTTVYDIDDYVSPAIRLSQGYFSVSETSRWFLWFGPGYPIILTPFVLLKLPWLAAKLLNAFFLFGAIVYFYKTLSFYIEKERATIFTLFLGLYPPLFKGIHQLLPECLVIFLVCGFIYHFCRLHREFGYSWFHLLATSIYLGYLALTKIFFGYVILSGLLSFLTVCIWRRSDKVKKTTYIYLMALIWCIPYLLYTYSLTGKVFYWGASGGMSLYWMSASYNTDEWGSWLSSEHAKELSLSPHRDFFEKMAGLSTVAQDDAFKKQAIENIIHYPVKFCINWVANIGRLLFSYPFSFTSQKLSTYYYMLPNMFIVTSFTLSIYPAILRRKTIPYEMYALLFFILIAFGGTSLLSAYERQFRPLVPVLLLWLSFIYVRVLKIEIRSDVEIS